MLRGTDYKLIRKLEGSHRKIEISKFPYKPARFQTLMKNRINCFSPSQSSTFQSLELSEKKRWEKIKDQMI